MIGECKCIYQLDKRELLGALDRVIEQENESIDYFTFRKNTREIQTHSKIKKQFDDERARVANTPECTL